MLKIYQDILSLKSTLFCLILGTRIWQFQKVIVTLQRF